jgi:asparagine synthetase B (glutamine-hydrolysing)
MTATIAEVVPAPPVAESGWVAVVGAGPVPDAAVWTTPREAAAPGVVFWVDAGGSAAAGALTCAHDERWGLAFDGVLQNAQELAAEFGLAGQPSPADVALAGTRRVGIEPLLRRLRGVFAVLAWDAERGVLTAARDQVGIHPLYWARSSRGLAFSSSVDALLGQPGVSRDLDPVALAEYLAQRHTPNDETFYAAVRRCPPGTVVSVARDGAVGSSRYWSPLQPEETITWLRDDAEAAARFDEAFTRAVARNVGGRRPALFLSGGLDSIAVGAIAADLQGQSGREKPLALSLGFEEPDCDERDVQRRVAQDLGLEQVLLPFSRAVERDQFIAGALRMGADWPFPMWNVWSPAYEALARAARDRGCDVVLTGRGGDEWLTVSPYYAADLVRRGNVVGLAHLLWSRNRSRRHTGWRYSWHLLKDRVGRPLASAAADAVAPRWWHERRRRRLRARVAPWVAPEASVRAAMDARLDQFIGPARLHGGFYVREMLATLSHPCVTGDLEETQEFGRRVGVRQAHPYWDVDLVELLFRMPPRMLDGGGRSKAPLRRMLASRFPGVGLERQKKAHALGFFDSMMRREAPAIWRELGGLRALHRLGVVDAPAAERHLSWLLEGPSVRDPGRVIEVLTLETWARHRLR